MKEERRAVLFLVIVFAIILLLKLNTKVAEPVYSESLILDTQQIAAKDIQDIISLDSPFVQPVLYSGINFLDSLDTQVAKEKFIAVMLPAILVAKWQLRQELNRLGGIIENGIQDQADSVLIENWEKAYRTSDLELLQRRLQVHPNSIALAQAAVESGWGKSRFFKEANNVFGVWSFNANEPRIPARISREDYTAYLRKYNHIAESVMDYFKTIARTPAYQKFRIKRMETDDIRTLVPYLDKYSERGKDYTDQLLGMIRYNDFEKYDTYQLDTSYMLSR